MANRTTAHGLTKDVKDKLDAKYNVDDEKQVIDWITAVTGKTFCQGTGQHAVYEALKSGVVLCELMNKLKPGAIKRINTGNLSFKQVLLSAIADYGVIQTDSFQTVDLFDMQNMTQVITCIMALGRKSQTNGFTGPVLGPKEADKNVRDFTEDQLNESKKVIGLQYGSTKGANQSGMNFGKARHIID